MAVCQVFFEKIADFSVGRGKSFSSKSMICGRKTARKKDGYIHRPNNAFCFGII
jgi:hypothetical protein